jgi:hypothetical protein
MDRPRILRLLRIAFSAVCGIVCVLLIVFWVRSYTSVENLYMHALGSNVVNFSFGLGQLAVLLSPPQPQTPNWRFYSQPAAPIAAQIEKRGIVAPTLKVTRGPVESGVLMRFWIPVIAAGTFAVIPWVTTPPRFGLRILFILVTLVAVVLGLLVLFSR